MRLELKGVTCGYWGRPVVSGVSLEVEAGEIMCLLGPNGSGKTTLFKTILGLLKPQAGEILLGGENICGWSPARIARVMGYIPQGHIPPFPFKVLDVVLMGRTAHLGIFDTPSPEDKEIAREAMAVLNISHLEERVYTELSGGERQLVLIARALAQQPQVLIMDEPTSSLDFGNQVMVLTQVLRLARRGLIIVMASHFPEHALLYASKVLLLQKGRVVGQGRPEDLLTEASLKGLYGIEVKIAKTVIDNGKELKVILPLEGCKN